MTFSQEQQAIISMLTRIYGEIRDIEEQFQLLAGDHDFRPRIEHFHDAVRAYSSQNPMHEQPGGRLTVERLAYDLSCLRYIHSMPLAPFKPHGAVLSPATSMLPMEPGLMVIKPRPDRLTKERIMELYQHYAVLFAALLKPCADRDYKDRTDNLNQDVQDLHQLVAHFAKLTKNKNDTAGVGNAILHMEDAHLRHELLQFMHQQHHKQKDKLATLQQLLKATIDKKNKDLKSVDTAHMNYALSQLGIFEGSKDLLKKMATQGMNLVGKFVEASVADSRRDIGR